MAQEVIHERRPDTLVVHDHDHYDDRPANNFGIVLAVIAILIVLLILIFGVRAIGGGGHTTNVNVPKPTVNVPSGHNY